MLEYKGVKYSTVNDVIDEMIKDKCKVAIDDDGCFFGVLYAGDDPIEGFYLDSFTCKSHAIDFCKEHSLEIVRRGKYAAKPIRR